MKNNNPPFVPGQEIIRTGPSNQYVTKGAGYTCHECFACPSCGSWKVTLIEHPFNSLVPFHCGCGSVCPNTSPFMGGLASNFAPIRETRDHKRIAVPEELLHIVERDTIEPVKIKV